MEATDRKRIVRATQKGLDREIARWQAKGWWLRIKQTDYWRNGDTVYISELEKG